MKRFEDLICKAEAAGCLETVSELAQQAEELLRQEKIHVAFIGGRNSGKTTLINGIVGQDVRVPDMLSQKEKPLRIAFEEMESDPRCDCETVEHDGWKRENVIFYEIKADEILTDDGGVSPLMNRMDCVFYTVSALMPMTGEDVRLIEALKLLPLKVVLTKTDLVDGAAVEKVVDFVSDICSTHDLEQPIILNGMDRAECIGIIRSSIPQPEKLEELRSKHLEMIADQARLQILKAAEAALEENRKEWRNALLASQKDDIKNKRAMADWNSLRADMLAKGLELSNDIAEKLEEQKTTIVEALFQKGEECGFSRSWQKDELDAHTRELFEKCLEEQTEAVQAKLNEDVSYMTRHALWLGLIQDASEVERILVDRPHGSVDKQLEKEFAPLFKSKQLWKTVAEDVIIFGVLMMPSRFLVLHAFATFIGTAAISRSLVREYLLWKDAEWRTALTKYVTGNFDAIINEMREAITDGYGELVDRMALQAQSLEAQIDDSAYVTRRHELEKISESLM